MHVGFTANAIDRRMTELGVSSVQLAARSGVAYETVRKVVSGHLVPTDSLARTLCAALDISYRDLKDRLIGDRILKTHGPNVWKLYGRNPRFADLYVALDRLDLDDLEPIVEYARFLAERNRAAEKNKQN